jgi:Protein of unknown function (DUF2950)
MRGPRDGNRAIAGTLTLTVLLIALVAAGPGISRLAFAQEPGQKTFSSPAAAAAALVAATKKHDKREMLAILGPSAKDLIFSGDRVADRKYQKSFVEKYRQMHRFVTAGNGLVFLYVGAENWPVGIPLQKSGDRWHFDTAYGKQEILYRRIGFNELNVIKVCQAIVTAQQDYHSTLHDGASVHQYAEKFGSTPGKQDGLYWKVKPGQPESPLGPLVAEAASEGYGPHHGHHKHTVHKPRPFHGYIYRLLTGQGPGAPGGAKSYIVDGKMTGGFALLAYPARYKDSGVMTFIVNQDGKIYQKDLGPQTEKIAAAMTEYNPDKTWQPAEEGDTGGNP